MKTILVLIILVLSGCVTKTLVKNCEPPTPNGYSVCDTVIFK